MNASEHWPIVCAWMDRNRGKIRNYVIKHHLLHYSAYDMDDFIAESYLIAYEAFSRCGREPFDGWFWTLFKNRCRTVLANKPHTARFSQKVATVKKQEDEESEIPIPEWLTDKQREVFENGNLSVSEIARRLGVSRQAVQQRIKSGIRSVKGLRAP